MGIAERYDGELRVYHGICIGSTIIGMLCIGWILQISPVAMLLVSVVLVWFSPLRIDLNVANVNQIRLGMFGVFALVLCGGSRQRRRLIPPHDVMGAKSRWRSDGDTGQHFAASLWLGLCLAFKPSLLWVAVMWLGYSVGQVLKYRPDAVNNGKVSATAMEQRHARWGPSVYYEIPMILLGGLAGAILAIVFSLFWFPMSAWFDWIQAVQELPDDIIRTGQVNFSPTYYAQHSLHLPSRLLMLSGPCLALASAFALYRVVPTERMSSTGQPQLSQLSE